MAKVYLSNAFSINMLGALPPEGRTIKVRPVILEEVIDILEEGYTSAVGHPSTAQVLSLLLGMEVSSNRVAITLSPGDRVIVFQLGVRLEEGRILSEEEVLDLYNRGQASFVEVEVVEG